MIGTQTMMLSPEALQEAVQQYLTDHMLGKLRVLHVEVVPTWTWFRPAMKYRVTFTLLPFADGPVPDDSIRLATREVFGL